MINQQQWHAMVTGQFVDKPTHSSQVADWSTFKQVNSLKCLTQSFLYIIAISTISSKLH